MAEPVAEPEGPGNQSPPGFPIDKIDDHEPNEKPQDEVERDSTFMEAVSFLAGASSGEMEEFVLPEHPAFLPPPVLGNLRTASEPQPQGAAKIRAFRNQALPVLAKLKARLWDKLAFVLGSTCMWACAFWLGRSPQSFWQLYTLVGVVLFAARYFSYRKRKWHYYLLDLCYACNALLMWHVWVQPRNRLLATTTFAFNTGPLTASIMAFRNSLVYHDMDRVTSCYLHLVPACVSWAQRWYPDKQRFQDVNSGPAGVLELVLVPLAFYVVWASLYSFVIFVLAAERIRRKGNVTLFTYVTTRKAGAYASITRRVRKELQPAIYLILHMCFCGASLLLALAAWKYFVVHTFLLILAASLAIANGANYYFEVFAKRHRSDAFEADAARQNGLPATGAAQAATGSTSS